MKQVLQYIWIEKWHCIDHQGFSFSEEYSIEYDEANHALNIEKNENYYSNGFWGKNIDLTAVVGENGTGKTTFLRTLLALSNYQLLSFGYIAVYKIEDSLKIYYHKVPIEKYDKAYCIEKVWKKYSIKFDNSPEAWRYIYYTGVMNKIVDSYDSIPSVSDLSTYSLMKKNKNHGIDIFCLNEFTKQIRFFLKNKNKIEDFGIKYPKYVTIFFNNNKEGLEEIIRRYYGLYEATILTTEQIKEKSDGFIHNFLGIGEGKDYSTPNELFEANLSCAMFLSIIQRLCKSEVDDKMLKNLWNKLNSGSDEKSPFERIKNFLSLIEFDFCFPKDKYVDFIKYIEKEIIPHSNFSSFSLKALRFTMNADPDKKILGVDVNGVLQDFVRLYETTINEDGYLLFEWGLSSGESLLFSTFARLYDEENNRRIAENYKKTTNVLVLLDEAEVSFHPEWQRKYLKCMLSFLSDLYSDIHIQIVIATHSPIMLSDIPRQNIIYLKKDKERSMIVDSNDNHSETFGANIFRLYNDSFFLDKGAIGAFAKDKLEKLLEEILSKTGKKEDIQKRIHMIGDVFLRGKFQDLFDSNYNLTLDEEIAKLEKEIEQKKLLREKNRL